MFETWSYSDWTTGARHSVLMSCMDTPDGNVILSVSAIGAFSYMACEDGANEKNDAVTMVFITFLLII